jgi:nitrate/TMAO reductase-like tetraheme cytochrome c subunit
MRDPAEMYATRFLIAILVFGVSLLAFSLLRYRGRTDGPAAWAALILGVLIVPPISTMFGIMLAFERAERVEFCGSCHGAMKAYVDDMRDPASDSLAALHYKNSYIPRNQCYTCHTSFGIFGTVEAKIAGMVDVHKYYTHSFREPLTMREPYRNDDCLKCHGGSVKWSANHADSKAAILAREMRCLDCHGQTHPPHKIRRTT